MTWLAGVDGCRKGWFRVCRETASGDLVCDVIETVAGILTHAPVPLIVVLDMPIGLPAAGVRDCDRAARAVLGPRRNSVFPAPIRAAVTAMGREEACEITMRADGRRVGVQAWAIYPKIREVDEVLAANIGARTMIREVHPEVCFWAWNEGRPMTWPKKTAEGLRERLALAEAWLGEGILERARGEHSAKDLADDDVLDAIAGLWTAHRIADRSAETLPASPPLDDTGLPMEIVF